MVSKHGRNGIGNKEYVVEIENIILVRMDGICEGNDENIENPRSYTSI